MARCVLTGVHFRAPQNPGNLEIWKPGIPARGDVLEIRPRCRRSRPAWGSGGRAGERLEKLRIWRSGAARRAGAQREVREAAGVPERVGRQNFRISGFRRADAQVSRLGVSCRPRTDTCNMKVSGEVRPILLKNSSLRSITTAPFQPTTRAEARPR